MNYYFFGYNEKKTVLIILTKAVSNNLATANNDGSRLEEANSMLSSDNRDKASIKYFTEISDNSVEDSNNRVTMLDNTGRSAMTAVVITELFSVVEEPEVVNPLVIGFNPKIHTKCCNVWTKNK